MGYHVAIVRTGGDRALPLVEREIMEAVEESAGLSFDGTSVFRRGEFFLSFSNGELWLSNPDESDLEEMIGLARRLEARVRGDELETYRSPTESYAHPDDARSLASSELQSKAVKAATRRRQWLLNASVVAFFVSLILLFKVMGWLD